MQGIGKNYATLVKVVSFVNTLQFTMEEKGAAVFLDGEKVQNSEFLVDGIITGLELNKEVIISIEHDNTLFTTRIVLTKENKLEITNENK